MPLVCAVHSATAAALHHWRLARSPGPGFGSTSLRRLERQWGPRAAFETAWRVFLYKRSEAGLARPRGMDHGEVPPLFTAPLKA